MCIVKPWGRRGGRCRLVKSESQVNVGVLQINRRKIYDQYGPVVISHGESACPSEISHQIPFKDPREGGADRREGALRGWGSMIWGCGVNVLSSPTTSYLIITIIW
jgi:hypothetical protein